MYHGTEVTGHRWNAADSVTALRIAAVPPLLFLSPQSAGFLIIYTLSGLSDALDGWLARKLGVAGGFGAKLDSIADVLFFCVFLLRLTPVLWKLLPGDIWCAAGAALLVRLAAYAIAAVKYRRFAALHTWLNKLTGGAIFLVPYALGFSFCTAYCRGVCALALAAAIEELIMHLRRGEYCPDVKSLFIK